LSSQVPRRATLMVCVGIQDPENLGSILRTSAAFGVSMVLLGPHCADPFSRRVARTSMGANFRLPVVESLDLQADLLTLRDEFGVRLVATVLGSEAQPLPEVAVEDRHALLFGSEGHGLDQRWVELCDLRVTIPMRPAVDSLNVSVAAGVVLYHFSR
jgi:tRNA G18 (ribose-2'-O)-methylase SpoU